ncbi:MAG: ATPase, T2SS/T4P/T4SS family [Pseudomonadota bacterium]
MLTDLAFSDLFVAEDPRLCWFKPTPDSLKCEPVSEELTVEITQLRTYLDGIRGSTEFRVVWPQKGSQQHPLRVKKMFVAEGKVVYICRRYRMPAGSLMSLGMPKAVATKLLDANKKAGLYIFFGKTGSGKTTTAASFVLERLHQYGGVCITAENPIELDLQGPQGKGWCYQTEVDSDDAVGERVKDMMRASPNIIFIGEIRTAGAARVAITAGNSGHIVVATHHSADLTSGLSRLAWLAGDEEAKGALADAFQMGVHLCLYNADPSSIPSSAFTIPDSQGTGTPPRVLSVEPLWKSDENASSIASAIRDGQFHMLKNEINLQRRRLMNGGPLP